MSKDNPQLNDGYTKIANPLLDAILLARLSREEMLITIAIVRQTYGWNKKQAAISYSIFVKLTGIDRRHIARGLNSLLEKDLIKRTTGAKMKYGKPVYKYSMIKKHYCRIGNSTGAYRATEAIALLATNKESKETLKKGRKELVDNLTI